MRSAGCRLCIRTLVLVACSTLLVDVSVLGAQRPNATERSAKTRAGKKTRDKGMKRDVVGTKAQEEAGAATSSPEAIRFRDLLRSTDELTSWSGQTLRDGLARLAETAEISIWLDRRVDPDQPLEFSMQGSLEQRLRGLASQLGLGLCYVETVVYLGPPELTDKLATVAALRSHAVRAGSKEPGKSWGRAQPAQWESLTTPRELIERWAAEADVAVLGLELIPHDLWPAMQLPALRLSDRLSLVLAGFDLTFEPDATSKGIRLVPLPASVTITQSYSLASTNAGLETQLKSLHPAAKFQFDGSKFRVTGAVEVHRDVQDLLRGRKLRPTPIQAEGEKRFDLKVEAPLEQVLKTLSRSFGLQLAVSPEIAPKLKERISVNVTQATRDELLAKVLGQVGLTFQIRDRSLIVVPGE